MATRTDDFSGTLSNWTPAANSGDWSISGGALVFAPAFARNNNAMLRWSGAAMDSADYTSTITMTKASDSYRGPGPGVRGQPSAISGYSIQAYADAYYLVEVTSGSEATLATYGNPGTTAVTVAAEAEGSTIRMFISGTQRGSVTDTTYSTGVPWISVGDYDSGTVTFDNFTAQDLGAAAITGTLSATLGAVTSSSAGAVAIVGSLSATLGALSLSAAGSLESTAIEGALSATLGAVTLSSAGAVAVDGALSATLGAVTSSAAGALAIEGASTITLGALSFAAIDYGLRFYGNDFGTGTTNIDRVQIPLEVTGTPTAVDVGAADFTYEFWLRCAYADNASSGIGDARESNIFFDRDIWGDPAGHVIGVTRDGVDLVVCFGLAGAGSWTTIYGSTDVGDDAWHHVAIVRTQSTGVVRIYVDGTQDASGTYTTGDISFAGSGGGGGSPNGSDPYIVLGAEKHDADPDVYLSYNGLIDEVRISDSARYTSTFTPPTTLTVDADTVGLWLLDDGTGTTATDSAGSTDGSLLVGGTNSGPAWTVIAQGAVGELAIAATLSATLATLTSNATGDLDIEGALSATLGAATLAAEGVLVAEGTGTLSATLAALSVSAAGAVAIEGVLSTALATVSVTSIGVLAIEGALSTTLAAVTLAAAGDLETGNEGQLSATLGALVVTSLGALAVTGATSATLGALTSSAAGAIAIQGQAAIDLSTLTLTGVGVAVVAAAIAGTVSGVSAVGTIFGLSAAGTLTGTRSTGAI